MSRITSTAIAATLLGISAAASAQTFRYSVTVLNPLPGHAYISTNAINNRGEVVGVLSTLKDAG